jgi:hypothetical protein
VEEYEALVREIFSTHYLTNGGAQHQRLEAALRDHPRRAAPAPVYQRHLALECAISAFGFDGGEIITTPFPSSPHARDRALGLTPGFATWSRPTTRSTPSRSKR